MCNNCPNKTEWTRYTAKPEAGSRPLPAPKNAHLETKDCLEARLIELDLLEQAINEGRDIKVFKLQRLIDLKRRLNLLTNTEEKT